MMPAHAKVQGHEDVFTQSFALQYISLILFILIFSIAAFLPKEKIEYSEPIPQPSPVAERAAEESPMIASVIPPNLLVRGTMQYELMAPYITLITQHDLHMTVTFFWSENTSRYAALTRAAHLGDYLEQQGVSPEAYMIETRYQDGGEPISIEIHKGADAWNVVR